MKRFLYPYMRWVSSIQYWMERRFTKAGLLALTGLVASAVLGLDTNRTVAYQVVTFLFCLLMVSLAFSLSFRARLAVERILPQFGTVGQPLSYRIRVRNLDRRALRGLTLLEDLLDPRPSLEEFTGTPEPGEERRNWFDRAVGYPRWRWLVSRNRPGVIEEQALSAIPADDEVEVRAGWVPSRRGHVRFAGVTVARADPFGLFKGFVSVPLPQHVLITPKRYALPQIQLPGGRRYQQGGVPLASSVGDSEEFLSLRAYRPGDPLRHIHWKSWARVGRPIVKEHQSEFFVRHALVLDTFQEAEHSEVFEEAVSVAASFACSVRTQESLLDVMFVGPEAYCETVGRGLGRTDTLLEVLACVQPCKERAFETLHHLVVGRSALLSGCVCIFLSWDDARQNLVKNLNVLGIPALILIITEAGFPHAPAPGPMKAVPEWLHRLEVGKIQEGLANL